MKSAVYLTLLSVAQATVMYSNQAYPYIPLRLSDGVIAYPSRIIDHTFPIPQHCVKWSDGCTQCDVLNGAIKTCHSVSHNCKFTRCLPVCTQYAQHVMLPPENCLHWSDGCNNNCDVQFTNTQYVSSISGAAFTRPVYNTLLNPCAYGKCNTRGRCLRHRQCSLTTIQHTECNSLFQQYSPLYNGLGYNANYVPTFATPTTTATHVETSTQFDVAGHSYYAPKTTVALSHDLQTQYANMLSHQSQYLMKHENVLKTNMLSDPVLHGYGDIDSYYYHLEQQRSLVDDMHFRVANGGWNYGYHYNPYYGAGHYPYAGYQYSQNYEHSVKQSTEFGYGYGHPYTQTSVTFEPLGGAAADAAVEEEAPELTPGEIAGIVIGSVVGCLLILLLCALARNSMGRSRQMPPQYPQMRMPPSHPDTSLGDMTDGPDILDYSGKAKPVGK